VAGRAALRLDLIHAAGLNLGGLLAGLLHFQKHRPPALQAKQVWDAGQLVRAAVDLHDPPALLFGYSNNRSNDVGLAWHSFAFATASPLKQRRHDSHTRTIESLKLSGQS
jgi:hypothetical protein